MVYIQNSYNITVHTFTGKSPFETCFGYFPPSPLDVAYEQRKDITRDALKTEKFVEKNRHIHLQVHETLCKSYEIYKTMNDQHRTKKLFKVGDRVWLHLNKKRLKGPCNKIKALQYGHFEIMEKVRDNSHRLNTPPYMCIYSIVNVENLKLYEPSMLDKVEE